MTSPSAVLDMIRRELPAQGRYAIVTAVSAGPPVAVTVRFIEGGDTFQPDVLGQAALPSVGARALILPVAGRWVLAGVVTAPSSPPVYRTLELPLVNNWHLEQNTGTGAWWLYDYVTNWDARTHGTVMQGRWPFQGGGAGDGSEPVVRPADDVTHLLYHGARAALDAIAAAAGTVHLVTLSMTRSDTLSNPQAAPRMFGHKYTTASPPPEGSPSWVSGYGPLTLAPFQLGQTVTWTLPSTWVVALATGVLTGIAFSSTSPTDAFSASSATELDRHASLRLIYTAPTEVTL